MNKYSAVAHPKWVKVAVVQFKPAWSQKNINLDLADALILDAARQKAALVVLPEMCTTGYSFADKQEIAAYVEGRYGKTFEFFRKIVRQHKIHLVYGYPEVNAENYYNSQNFIDPQGELIATYRKKNLFSLDQPWANAGNSGYINCQTSLGCIGLGICMDMNIDSFLNFHCQKGSALVAVSSCWLVESEEKHLDYWRTRWKKFSGVVAIANMHGLENSHLFAGNSCVIEENTTVAHCAADRNQVLVTEHNLKAAITF